MNRSKWTVATLVLATVALGTGCAHAQYRDRDNNPPGWRGGHGTNWENPPGPRGGPGISRDAYYWRDRDSNPPGWRGGPGTNWENPPGWRGGPGASPDYRYWRYSASATASSASARLLPQPYTALAPPTGCGNAAARAGSISTRTAGPRGGPRTKWENPPAGAVVRGLRLIGLRAAADLPG